MTLRRWLLFTFLLLEASRASADSGVVRSRPFHFRVPAGNDGTPKPLVVVLHGIGVTATYQQQYFQMADLADQRGFFVVYPEGTRSALGQQFWNGVHCCQIDLDAIDDVGYIDDIITFMKGRFAIDSRKVFLFAHSNGAFLANKYACERSQVAAIVTISGAQYPNPLSCGNPFPETPIPIPWPFRLGHVSVLHVHGTLDELVGYNAPAMVTPPPPLLPYPFGLQTVANWLFRNGCDLVPPVAGTLDLMSPAGNETGTQSWEGCFGASVAFWTVVGADHVPNFYRAPDSRAFTGKALDWLFAHPGP